jgi:two-component system OmpR family response regulator
LTITRRILIVDDEDQIITLLRFYFTKLGWEVVSAGSGAAALKAFEADKFHVLLADVDLGDKIDGIEVARRLLDQHPHLKVVMMSGKPENKARVRDAKVGAFIPKPFELPSLINILNGEFA